jgi:hypothetical protein
MENARMNPLPAHCFGTICAEAGDADSNERETVIASPHDFERDRNGRYLSSITSFSVSVFVR